MSLLNRSRPLLVVVPLFWLFLVQMLPGQAEVAAPGTGYVIKPNDTLELAVFDEDDLSTSTRVLKSGEAVFPLIGAVKVGGLQVAEATRRIHDLYAADYLVNPKVSLTVSAYAAEFVSVLGSVKSPGNLTLPESGVLDLASALALAGGLADDADAGSIQVVRAGSGGSSMHAKAAIDRGRSVVQLRAGDRVIVGQSPYLGKSVIILGRVARPGPVALPVDGRLGVVEAISMAGGFHELANPRKVSLNRKGKVQVIDVRALSETGGAESMLEPGDVVTVPERIF